MSSTARGASAGSSRSSRSWSGLRNSVTKELPSWLTVVSWPATRSRLEVREQLGLGEVVTFVVSGDHRRDQGVVGVRPLLADEPGEVVLHLLLGLGQSVGRVAEDPFGEPADVRAVGVGRRAAGVESCP